MSPPSLDLQGPSPPSSRPAQACLKCSVHNLINDGGLGAEFLLMVLHPSHQLQEVDQELLLPGKWGEARLGNLLGWAFRAPRAPRQLFMPVPPLTYITLELHFQPQP